MNQFSSANGPSGSTQTVRGPAAPAVPTEHHRASTGPATLLGAEKALNLPRGECSRITPGASPLGSGGTGSPPSKNHCHKKPLLTDDSLPYSLELLGWENGWELTVQGEKEKREDYCRDR